MAFQVEFLTLFNHFLVIVGFGLFWVGNLVKVSNVGDPQASILGPTFLIFQIDDPLGDVICNIAIYADDITLYRKCNQASDLWQQVGLASELESVRHCGQGWEVDCSFQF